MQSNKNKFRKGVFIVALIMLLIQLLRVDYDALTNLKINLSAYLGILSMALVGLSMFLSIKYSKDE